MKRVFRTLKRVRWVTLLILLAYLFSGGTASADISQKQAYQLGIYGYDVNLETCDTSTASANINGVTINHDAITAYQYFIKNGYSDAQAAGIVGNLMWESGPPTGQAGGVDPTTGEAGGGGGYGIAQFTGAELTNFKTYAAAQNEDFTTLQAQLDYLAYALSNTYTSAKTAIQADTTPSAAAADFMNNYEHPAKATANLAQRQANAEALYQSQGGTSAAPSASETDSVCGSTGGTTCNGPATGNAQILAAAECYKGIYYWNSTIDPHYNGGHGAYSAFRQGCPLTDLPAAESANLPPSEPGAPGPCATDCSGLVSVAVDQVYDQSFSWTVDPSSGLMEDGNGVDTADWKKIDISQAQIGDIITKPDHVEIIEQIQKETDGSYSVLGFGSHQTGEQTGPDTGGAGTFGDYFTQVFRYVGPTRS